MKTSRLIVAGCMSLLPMVLAGTHISKTYVAAGQGLEDVNPDLNGDEFVDSADLLILLSHWQESLFGSRRVGGIRDSAKIGPLVGDVDGNGSVDIADLVFVSIAWYSAFPPPIVTPTSTPSPDLTPARSSTPTQTRESPSPTLTSTLVLKATDSIRVMPAIRDTYLAEIHGASNFGSSPVFRARWNPQKADEEIGLLWFDLTDVVTGTEVYGAYVSLILQGTHEGRIVTASVHRVFEPWDETLVTWESQPVLDQEAITSTIVGVTTETEIYLDVTALVRDWVDDPASNHGMAFRMTQDPAIASLRSFGSRESNAPPRLNLAYTVPGPEVIEIVEPTPTLPSEFSETILSVSESAYARWEGRESYDANFADPGLIRLSYDYMAPFLECYLLSFDLSGIPPVSEIYQAYLELSLEAGENPEPIILEARMMDTDWSAENVTWRSILGAYNSEGDAPAGLARVGLDFGPVRMDVTRVVGRWMRNPSRNYGFHLGGEEGTAGPWTRIFGGTRRGIPPRLIVRYGEASSPKNAMVDTAKQLPPKLCTEVDLGTPPPFRRNWLTIYTATEISGSVNNPRISYHEWPSSHDCHDLVFEIRKNPSNSWATSVDNPNDIEAEWEKSCMPLWSWPTHDEEVTVFGPLIYDCGHGSKTEIHPPRGWAVFRKNIAADVSAHNGIGVVLASRADVFFSNRRSKAFCGGYCEVNPPGSPLGIPVDPIYVPINDRDYEFKLYPPNNKAEGAQLVAWTENRSWNWGQSVKPFLTLHETANPPYVQVQIPFQSSYGSVSGKMHTAASVYCAWTRTEDPDLRAFKVSLDGVDIEDEAEGLLKNGGEFYMWMNVADNWFDLRDYVPGIAKTDDDYHAATKPLDAHVIVPNTSDGRITVRASGYEADYYEDLYGWDWPWPVYLAALVIVDDNDQLQSFNKTFVKSEGFGGGTTALYKAQGGEDGKYGLKLTVVEEQAPFQARFIKAGIAEDTVDIHDGCLLSEYQNSQDIGFDVIGQSQAEVTASYDQDALYVCVSGILSSGAQNDLLEGREVVLYFDPGAPSQPKIGSNWVGRDDDLRIAFHAGPATGVVVHRFDKTKDWYAIPVTLGLVDADIDYGFYHATVEFRIDKSLIPNGPWSQTVSETSLIQKGIGFMIAIEKPTEARSGAWPTAAWPTAAHEWARMWFELACPINFWAERIGDKADNTRVAGGGPVNIGGQTYTITPAGDVVTVKLKYQVGFEHPRCYLVGGILKADVPDLFEIINWSPKANSTFQNGNLSWALASASTAGEFTYTIRQTKQCDIGAGPSNPCPPDTDTYAGGTLTTGFQSSNVPAISKSASVSVGDCFCARGIPDTRQWPPGWPLGKTPPWVLLHDPLEFGDPVDLILNIRNENPFDRRVIVQAMEMPMGISSSHPGANPMLDFSGTPEHLYALPADSEIAVNLQMQLEGYKSASKSLIGSGNGGAVAVQIFDPDRGEYQVSTRQVVPYLPLAAGGDNHFPMRFYPTMLEPGEITIAGWAYEPGWEVAADPNVIPVTTTYSEENPPTVLVHIQPPQGELLGSGRPIDIVAWTDTGEIVGTQRILDLPPVQFSPEQPPFAHGDLFLEPPVPEIGEDVSLCAVLRNRSDAPVSADVELGRSDILSTAAASFEPIFLGSLEVPPGGIGRLCSNLFPWDGHRSFQAILRQSGYRDQVIARNLATVSTPHIQPGGCAVVGEAFGSEAFDQTQADVGPVHFASFGGDVITTFHIYDCSGDGAMDIFVPVSVPSSGYIAMEFSGSTCDPPYPIRAEVKLRTGSGCALYGANSDGIRVATATAVASVTPEILVLSSVEGIRRIVVEGSEVCIQQVCWTCREQEAPLEPIAVLMEVRNPLESAQEITLARKLVGLNGWTLVMPDTIGLGAGEGVGIDVVLTPPPPDFGQPPFAGDETYLEIWAYTEEEQLIGGARIQVFRR